MASLFHWCNCWWFDFIGDSEVWWARDEARSFVRLYKDLMCRWLIWCTPQNASRLHGSILVALAALFRPFVTDWLASYDFGIVSVLSIPCFPLARHLSRAFRWAVMPSSLKAELLPLCAVSAACYEPLIPWALQDRRILSILSVAFACAACISS